MLEQASVIAFVPVSDLKTAEHFYARQLGLPVVTRGPMALILQGAGNTLIRCVLTPDATHQPFTILGWGVANLKTAVTQLRAQKIEPIVYPHFDQDADGIWTAPNGDQVVWFNDPDHNVLSLSKPGAAKQQ